MSRPDIRVRTQFLIRVYFGEGDPLDRCARRAYRDLNRTIRGIAGNQKAFTAALRTVVMQIEEIGQQRPVSQKTFDAWHRKACDLLIATYAQNEYPSFTVGQAQKWVNMTFKYVFTYGSELLPGYDQLYEFAHVPLDRILIEQLIQHGFEPLGCAWSKLNSYECYAQRQKWVRAAFPGSDPLDVEFEYWMSRQQRQLQTAAPADTCELTPIPSIA